MGEALPRHRQPAAAPPHGPSGPSRACRPTATAREGPTLHLVDGGVSDNVGMRGVLDALEIVEALHEARHAVAARPREEDHHLRREFAVVPAHQLGRVVQPARPRSTSCSSPQALPSMRFPTRPSRRSRTRRAQWQTMRMLRNSAAFKANTDPAVAAALRVPAAEIYAIDVSFLRVEGQEGAGAGGRRSPARRSGNDHRGVTGVQAAAEGCRGPAGGGAAWGQSAEGAMTAPSRMAARQRLNSRILQATHESPSP